MSEIILEVRNLERHFTVRRSVFGRSTEVVRAVDGVDLSVRAGTVMGLVGESGSGKSTLGRCIARLDRPTGGSVHFAGQDVAYLRGKNLLQFRRDVQTIFQDPFASLNPRRRIGEAITDGPAIHGLMTGNQLRDFAGQLLQRVGLRPEHVQLYPHEFSGGQRQRIAIARALALSPRFIVADEPVSALDVSVRAQILNLLAGIQAERDMAFLFITHDLAVVRHIADEIAIMRAGRIVERGETDRIFTSPQHAYTKELLSAIPRPDPSRRRRSRMRTRDMRIPKT
jgi:ABC-type oligopeptide transport system ATPase subunit